jgi:predicted ester cyclase
VGSIDTRHFYENYVNALNNHDFDRMDAFFSPSIRFQLYDTVQNFDELIGGLNGIDDAFPDWRWEILEVLFDGDLITARYADTGTHTGPFLGIEPTGRNVQALEFAVYRIVDDRISEMWSSLDSRDVIRQLS